MLASRRRFAGLTLLLFFSSYSPSQDKQAASSATSPSRAAVAIPGTGVTLVPPPDFVPASAFSGFEHPQTSSRIAVVEFPGPASMAIAGYNEEVMKKAHMIVQNKESVTVDGMAGLLIYALNDSNGTSPEVLLGQWALIFGNDKRTVTIVAYFPFSLANRLAKPIRDSLVSAKWQETINPLADLPFEITETRSLKFLTRTGNTVIYSGHEPGARLNQNPDFLAAELNEVEIQPPDRKEFCEAVLSGNPDKFGQVFVESYNVVSIDGLSGCEIRATAVQVKDGARMFLYQVLLFEGNRAFVAFGWVALEQRDRYLADFQDMVASFKRKR